LLTAIGLIDDRIVMIAHGAGTLSRACFFEQKHLVMVGRGQYTYFSANLAVLAPPKQGQEVGDYPIHPTDHCRASEASMIAFLLRKPQKIVPIPGSQGSVGAAIPLNTTPSVSRESI
jgi:hypothetical protein